MRNLLRGRDGGLEYPDASSHSHHDAPQNQKTDSIPLSLATIPVLGQPPGAQNILALDIAFGPLSACLLRRDASIFTVTGNDDRPHSQAIMPLLQQMLDEAALDWSELDMLAAGIGPGSFTGLRIAAATLAGINSSLQLPLIEMSSLAISAARADSDAPLYVIEDARANRAYCGRYQRERSVSADACLAWEELERLGPAAYTAEQTIHTRLPDWSYIPASLPRSVAMARVIACRSKGVGDGVALPRFATPAYLNPSQAELNASPS